MFVFIHGPPLSDGDRTISPTGLQTLVMEVLGEGAPPEDQVKRVVEKIVLDPSGGVELHVFLNLMSDKRFVGLIKYSHQQMFRVDDEDPSDRIGELLEMFGTRKGGSRSLNAVFEVFPSDDSGRISIAKLKEAFSKIGEPLVNLPPASQTHPTVHDIF